jgi:transposase
MKHNGYLSFLGIDISKSWFDVAIIKAGSPGACVTSQFFYTQEGFNSFLQFLSTNTVELTKETLICMEDTGIYCNQLLSFLKKYEMHIWVEMPLRINRSSGIERGTNDKLAAIKIATYSYRNSDAVKLYVYESADIQGLAILNAERKRLIKVLNILKAPVKEFKDTNQSSFAILITKSQKKTIAALQSDLKEVEKQIDKIINENSKLKRQEKVITSIKGVGPVTARHFINTTNGFTKFTNYKEIAKKEKEKMAKFNLVNS